MVKSSLNNQDRQTVLKRGYVKIFITAFIILFCGFVVISIASFIPRPSYSDPDYGDYQNLIRSVSVLAKLLIEIGLSLFSVSSFLGAITDANIADNIKRGMMVASGISVLGLVIVFIFPGLYIY